MAVVRILNNSMNPIGWRVGDIVELTPQQGLKDLWDRGAIEVIELSEDDKVELFPKKKVEVKKGKEVKKK